MTEDQINALIAAVRETSRKEILPYFRALDQNQIDSKSAADDLVTIADKASEKVLTAAARRILPGAAIVGEEAVSADASVLDQIGQGGQIVIIDPIDGTWNYANGLSTFGVILAVVEDGETVFGLLYDPSHDNWIMARKGQGTWFCREGTTPQKISVSAPGPLSDSFGLVGIYLFDKVTQAQIAQTLPVFRRTMSLRCSCHEYWLQASGGADFCLSGMLNPWDHAAGVLCLREAGGVAKLIDGTEYAPTMTQGIMLTASTPQIWTELAELWTFLR